MRTPDWCAIVRRRLEEPRPLLVPPTRPGDLFSQLEGRGAPGGASPLRASGLGACARQLAYRLAGSSEVGKETDARSRLAFAMGDFFEAFVTVALADAIDGGAAPGWALRGVQQHGGQIEVGVKLDAGLTLPGHPDGLLVGPGGTRIVLEVKSTSSWSFTEWGRERKAGREPWTRGDSYWWQLQAYLCALDAAEGYVLAVDKESGQLAGWTQERDLAWADEARAHVALAASGLVPEDVPRRLPGGELLTPSEAKGKQPAGLLPWQCVYCPFWGRCWKGAIEEVAHDWRGRPKRQLRVTKEVE